ncbi:MAG: rhodanese-like domain-containing protein [Patescibacteria group bacterium]
MIKPKNLRLIILFGLVALIAYLLGARQDILQNILQTSLISRPVISASLAIKAKEFGNLLKKKDFTLINVHTPYEGEIEKTDIFIVYNDLANNSSLLPFDKTTPIILYCKTGRMSAEAVVAL